MGRGAQPDLGGAQSPPGENYSSPCERCIHSGHRFGNDILAKVTRARKAFEVPLIEANQ
jgi:hypothetical protein